MTTDDWLQSKPRTPKTQRYRIVSAGLPDGSLELEAATMRLNNTGALALFDAAGRPLAGFAPGMWTAWQLVEDDEKPT